MCLSEPRVQEKMSGVVLASVIAKNVSVMHESFRSRKKTLDVILFHIKLYLLNRNQVEDVF